MMDNFSTSAAGLASNSQLHEPCIHLLPPSQMSDVIVPTIYIIICVIGLVGNASVLSILVAQNCTRVHGSNRSVTNILVINLAVADFIFVGALPFWATERFLRTNWIFGTVGCKLLSFMSLLNLYGSVFFLVAMAIDRFLAVVFAVRFRNHRTPKNAHRVCIVIWLFASVIASQALAFRETFTHCTDLTQCSWNLPSDKAYSDAYFVIRTALGFFIPFVVIVLCYILIMLRLRKRPENLGSSGARINSQQRKVTRLILCVISLFVICWLPNHIVTLMTALNKTTPEIRTAGLISSCLAYANSSLNPIVYAFMKEDVRQQGLSLINKCFGRTTAVNHTVPEGARSLVNRRAQQCYSRDPSLREAKYDNHQNTETKDQMIDDSIPSNDAIIPNSHPQQENCEMKEIASAVTTMVTATPSAIGNLL